MTQKEKAIGVFGGIGILAFGIIIGLILRQPSMVGDPKSAIETKDVVNVAKPSMANFQKIKIGMSKKDTEDLMGPPSETLDGSTGQMRFQSSGNVQSVSIWIDEDGKAYSVGINEKVVAKGPFSLIYTPQRPGSRDIITKRGGP